MQVTKGVRPGEWLFKCVLEKLLCQGMWRIVTEGGKLGQGAGQRLLLGRKPGGRRKTQAGKGEGG